MPKGWECDCGYENKAKHTQCVNCRISKIRVAKRSVRGMEDKTNEESDGSVGNPRNPRNRP